MEKKSKYSINEVLEFLERSKSRQQIAEEFGLSNSESWHLIRWMKKAKFIVERQGVKPAGSSPRAIFYKRVKRKE